MSLRTQFTLLLTLFVLLAVVFATTVMRKAALTPLQAELTRSRIHHTFRIADQLRSGKSLEEVRARGHLEISLLDSSPASPSGLGQSSEWSRRQIRGKSLLVRDSNSPATAMRMRRKWLLVEEHRETVGAPLLPLLAIGGFMLLVGVVWSGYAITRPLKNTQEALSRVSQGDFSQPLPETGGAELEEVARSFNVMSERIRTMLATEKQLMAGISHELRTPLARLRLHTEILRDSGVSEERLGAIEDNLEEIDTLIGEFLELSRLESGAAILSIQPVLLRSIAESIIPQLPQPQRFRLLHQSTPVMADPNRIKRVMSTILENAAKYAPEGPVEISFHPGGFKVRDHGPGVPKAELPRLFEAFFRGKGTHHAEGFGIGLSMAHQIVSLHGGQIQAKNHSEGGLEVSVELGETTHPAIDQAVI